MELPDLVEDLGVGVDGGRERVELPSDVLGNAGGFSFNRDVFREQQAFVKPVLYGLRVSKLLDQVLLVFLVLGGNAANVQGYMNMHVGSGSYQGTELLKDNWLCYNLKYRKGDDDAVVN